MKLRELTSIQTLSTGQLVTIKGGARDTRGKGTSSTSTYDGNIEV